MKNKHLITGTVLALLVSSCSAANDPTTKPPEKPKPNSCSVIDGSDWVAWLNRMPGPDGPSLHLSGKIVLPTPGYTIKVKAGPLDKSNPPVQRLNLELTPPTGIVAQVVSSQEVKVQLPALASSYGAVIVSCGDKTLATITDVQTVY